MCQMCVCVCTCATVHVVCMCVFCLHVRAYEAGYISYVHLGLCSLLMPALDLSLTLFPPTSLPALPPPPLPFPVLSGSAGCCHCSLGGWRPGVQRSGRCQQGIQGQRTGQHHRPTGAKPYTHQEQNHTPTGAKPHTHQEQNHTPIRSKTTHPSRAKPCTHRSKNHTPIQP